MNSSQSSNKYDLILTSLKEAFDLDDNEATRAIDNAAEHNFLSPEDTPGYHLGHEVYGILRSSFRTVDLDDAVATCSEIMEQAS